MSTIESTGLGGRLLRPRRLVMLAALLLPIILLSLNLWVKETTAYAQATRFVYQDTRIAALTGTINSVDFLFWHGFMYTGDNARFSFRATSGKGSYIVDVNLRKIVGKWRLKEADVAPRDEIDTLYILH